MFNLKKTCVNMFGSCKSFYEALSELNAQYETTASALPNADELITWLSYFPEDDIVELSCESIENWSFKSTNHAVWIDSYNQFIKSLDTDDDVTISLIVRKNINRVINVYSYDEIIKFFKWKNVRELINLFAQLFSEKEYLRFNVLDRPIDLFTKTIAFTDSNATWPIESFNRKTVLKNCEKANLFLNRNELGLLPQDFLILNPDVMNECSIKDIFSRLETVFEYVYIANNSYITNDRLVVQFDPAGKAFDFKLDEVNVNSVWRKIFEWAYDTDTAVERTAIARNIISINCKTSDQIENITEDTLSSIKSNFVIYQKSTVEKYIDAKKNIADNIVETSKQIQEMMQDLTAGLRNNFIAVIMFLITVILTDSMDWDDLIAGGIPKDIVYMSYLFAGASVFYLIITIFGTVKKWGYCKKGYFQLKGNYKELLEEHDLQQAFSYDSMIKEAKKQLVRDTIVVSIIWVAFLIIMVIFFTWMRCGTCNFPTT